MKFGITYYLSGGREREDMKEIFPFGGQNMFLPISFPLGDKISIRLEFLGEEAVNVYNLLLEGNKWVKCRVKGLYDVDELTYIELEVDTQNILYDERNKTLKIACKQKEYGEYDLKRDFGSGLGYNYYSHPILMGLTYGEGNEPKNYLFDMAKTRHTSKAFVSKTDKEDKVINKTFRMSIPSLNIHPKNFIFTSEVGKDISETFTGLVDNSQSIVIRYDLEKLFYVVRTVNIYGQEKRLGYFGGILTAEGNFSKDFIRNKLWNKYKRSLMEESDMDAIWSKSYSDEQRCRMMKQYFHDALTGENIDGGKILDRYLPFTGRYYLYALDCPIYESVKTIKVGNQKTYIGGKQIGYKHSNTNVILYDRPWSMSKVAGIKSPFGDDYFDVVNSKALDKNYSDPTEWDFGDVEISREELEAIIEARRKANEGGNGEYLKYVVSGHVSKTPVLGNMKLCDYISDKDNKYYFDIPLEYLRDKGNGLELAEEYKNYRFTPINMEKWTDYSLWLVDNSMFMSEVVAEKNKANTTWEELSADLRSDTSTNRRGVKMSSILKRYYDDILDMNMRTLGRYDYRYYYEGRKLIPYTDKKKDNWEELFITDDRITTQLDNSEAKVNMREVIAHADVFSDSMLYVHNLSPCIVSKNNSEVTIDNFFSNLWLPCNVPLGKIEKSTTSKVASANKYHIKDKGEETDVFSPIYMREDAVKFEFKPKEVNLPMSVFFTNFDDKMCVINTNQEKYGNKFGYYVDMQLFFPHTANLQILAYNPSYSFFNLDNTENDKPRIANIKYLLPFNSGVYHSANKRTIEPMGNSYQFKLEIPMKGALGRLFVGRTYSFKNLLDGARLEKIEVNAATNKLNLTFSCKGLPLK